MTDGGLIKTQISAKAIRNALKTQVKASAEKAFGSIIKIVNVKNE